MKTGLQHIIYSVFKIRFMESFLVGLLRISGSKALIKLAPPHTYYNEKDSRLCERYGIRYKLNLKDYQSWLLYFFSDEDSSFGSLRYLKAGDVCIDVGGNIGQTAMMMARKVGPQGKVYSFEPFTSTYNSFKENLTLNPGIRNVVLERMAVGETNTTLEMYVENAKNSGGNRIKPKGKNVNAEVQKVETVLLDEYCKIHSMVKVDMIKIDVEGFEMKVLKGSRELIKKFKPTLFIEVNDANLKAQGDSKQAMFDFLKANGYTIFNVEDGNELLSMEHFKGSDVYCKMN